MLSFNPAWVVLYVCACARVCACVCVLVCPVLTGPLHHSACDRSNSPIKWRFRP